MFISHCTHRHMTLRDLSLAEDILADLPFVSIQLRAQRMSNHGMIFFSKNWQKQRFQP